MFLSYNKFFLYYETYKYKRIFYYKGVELVDSKDWIILDALYEEGNITKTAERLYSSQPAITYRLQQLEYEFGVKILIRNKKGVKFTDEGEYLVKYAQKMIEELRQTKDHIQDLGGAIKGTLRIGVSSTFAQYKLPMLLKGFLSNYPHVQVNIKTGYSSEVFHMLKHDDVQIGIVRGEYNWDELSHKVYQEGISIISHEKLHIEDLPNLPRINYKMDPLFKQMIETWWYQTFTDSPHHYMKVDKIETCKEMVKLGLGYAIIPEICLPPESPFTTYNLEYENETLTRNTWMNYREKSLNLSVVKEFVDYVTHSKII